MPDHVNQPSMTSNSFIASLLHFLFCLVSLLGAIYFITKKITLNFAHTTNALKTYTPWAELSLATSKPFFLVYYPTVTALILIYSLIVFLCFKKISKISATCQVFKNPLFVIFDFTINMTLFFSFLLLNSKFLCFVLILGWLVILVFPFYTQLITWLNKPLSTHYKSYPKFAYSIIVIAIALYVYALSPFFQLAQLQVANDFLWIPEQTFLNNKYVDNNEYIMQHGIGGLFNTNLASANTLNLSHYAHLDLPYSENLSIYIQKAPQKKYVYYYSRELHTLFLKSTALNDTALLCTFLTKSTCRDLLSYKGIFKRDYNKEELEFIRLNSYELSQSLIAEHYFYHQFAMLGPINELYTGKDSSQIHYLYGLGNTKLLLAINTLFPHGLSFESYTLTLYSFYLIYLALFILVASILFNDHRWLMIATLLGIASFFANGFESIRLAPGFNPLRHLLDLPLILTLIAYLKASKNLQGFFLSICYFITLLAILANIEFGLMMVFALTGTILFHTIFLTKKYRFVLYSIAGICLGLGLAALLHFDAAKDLLGVYLFLGVSVAPTSPTVLFGLITIILIGYCGLFWLGYKKTLNYPPLYLLLFLFFYSQCLALYYIWYTEPGHLLMTSFIWILFLIYLLKNFLQTIPQINTRAKIRSGVTCATLLVFSCSALHYFKENHAYQRIFTTHKLYQWQFDRAHFVSTMDPAPFSEAVNLIQVFNKDNELFIISKYDYLLPFLAKKYSALPYLVLATSLVTLKEIQETADYILSKHPQYLFVDSDIMDSHFGDIIERKDAAAKTLDRYQLSYGRALVLNELMNVFDLVKNDYHLIKKGRLINVYKKN